MDYQSIATFIMEMAGTVAFAASGAMVGVERNMDIFGVSVLGVATAVGGGMIRDIQKSGVCTGICACFLYCVLYFLFQKRAFGGTQKRNI